MKADKQPIVNKTTVAEELEYWNVLYVFRRLNVYFRNRLRNIKGLKELQGMESNDFAMIVLEKIISEDFSWQRSAKTSFIDFVYDVARSEASHFFRDNKKRQFIDYESIKDSMAADIKDKFIGF